MTNEQRNLIKLSAVGKTIVDITALVDDKKFFDCDTESCVFNKNGQCRYAAVEDELPVITEEDGCLSGFVEE